MDAGQLDRKITLQRATVLDDGYASEVSAWVDLATVSARLMPLSSVERAAAGENAAFGKATFMIRRDSSWSDLNATDRLLYGAVPFNIEGVREHGRGFYMIDAVARAD